MPVGSAWRPSAPPRPGQIVPVDDIRTPHRVLATPPAEEDWLRATEPYRAAMQAQMDWAWVAAWGHLWYEQHVQAGYRAFLRRYDADAPLNEHLH